MVTKVKSNEKARPVRFLVSPPRNPATHCRGIASGDWSGAPAAIHRPLLPCYPNDRPAVPAELHRCNGARSLLAGAGRARVSRLRLLADTTVALSGMGVAAGGLVALIVSEHAPLFGFMEHGYRFAIVFTIASEIVAILALGIFLALSLAASRKRDSGWPSPAAPATVAPLTES